MFLTFRMVIGRASLGSDRDDHLGSSWSNFVHDIALKRNDFQLETHFKNITFSPEKRKGPKHVKI